MKKILKKKIKTLHDKRKNIYKLAKHKINCNDLNKKSIVDKILIFNEKQ